MQRILTVFTLILVLLAALSANAQEVVTPEVVLPEETSDTVQPPSVTAADQLVLDGFVTVSSVVSPAPGWLAIHADVNGQPGHTVGIAPVQAGTNENLRVMIDMLGATPRLYAVLHADDGTTGVYEYSVNPGIDAWLLENNQIVMSAFNIIGIRAYDQAVMNNTVVVASVVSSQGGWVVIHADNNGAPGAVLGQWLIAAGTTPAITVPVSGEGRTDVLWVMLHVDDGNEGVYEFDGQSGLDAPVTLNGTVATTPFNTTDAPTVLTADGLPLPDAAQPFISVFNQFGIGDGTVGSLSVNSVLSPGPGWTDVHADMDGHPGKSLGITPLPDGTTSNVTVALNAMARPLDPPTTLPTVVWPMLHVDTGTVGQYEYLMIPGVDLPVVANGRVVTYPVSIDTEFEATPEPTDEATAEPTDEATPDVTAEPTDEPTPDVTAEPTDEPTPEVTLPPGEGTPEVTLTVEPPPVLTETVEPPPPPPVEETAAPPDGEAPPPEATEGV